MESEERKGDRWLRLGDLAPHEVIVVRCPCGRNTEYRRGYLQRRHRVPSDTLVFDLHFVRARIAIGGMGFGYPFWTSGRDGIIRSRGWSGWLWRGSRLSGLLRCGPGPPKPRLPARPQRRVRATGGREMARITKINLGRAPFRRVGFPPAPSPRNPQSSSPSKIRGATSREHSQQQRNPVENNE